MKYDRNIAVGKVLRRLRKEIGLSQEQVATKVGLSQPIISKIEYGDRGLAFIETWLYAEALGTDVVALIGLSRQAMLADGIDPDEPPSGRVEQPAE